jgi:hypothetical protein
MGVTFWIVFVVAALMLVANPGACMVSQFRINHMGCSRCLLNIREQKVLKTGFHMALL